MPRISAEARQQANDRIAAGDDLGDIADAFGVSLGTVNKWVAENNGDPAPVGERVVTVSAPGAKRGRKSKAAPITEQTAGMLLEGIFGLIALADRDTVWLLNNTERGILSKPFADSLGVLPTPVADAINTYSAPAVFLSSLGGVVAVKMKQKSEKKRRGLTVVPPPIRPQPAQQQSATTPPPPPTDFSTESDSDVASALDAARGQLSEDQDISEMSFTGMT